MQRLCLKDFKLDGLIFVKGVEYKMSFNPKDGLIYIYNPFGYTTISHGLINYYFL